MIPNYRKVRFVCSGWLLLRVCFEVQAVLKKCKSETRALSTAWKLWGYERQCINLEPNNGDRNSKRKYCSRHNARTEAAWLFHKYCRDAIYIFWLHKSDLLRVKHTQVDFQQSRHWAPILRSLGMIMSRNHVYWRMLADWWFQRL